MIALSVALAQFMQMLDSVVISIALPPMAHDFHASPVSVGFGITVYVLAAAIMLPASAWLADRLGARNVFIFALAAFAATSALCGISATLWEFIAARALQGLAGALMAPVGQMILLRSVDRAQLLRIMTLTSTPSLIAPVIGPPLGGFLATWFGWPWIFYINLPASILAIYMALRWLPNPVGDKRPFDLAGFLLNAGALAPLLWGLGQLASGGVSRVAAIGAVAAGGLMGVVAVRHAARAPHPLLSLSPLRHVTFRLTSSSSTALIRLPIATLIFVLPILFERGFGMTPFMSGVLFLGHSTGDLSMKLFTTRVYRRLGYRTTLLVCSVGMAFAIAASALFTRSTPLLMIAFILFVAGCFRSFTLTGLTSLAFSEVERNEMPNATTLNQVTVQLTTGLGVSCASLLFGLSRTLRGVAPGAPDPADCRLALVVMAAMALLAVPLFMKLPHDAGSELSGHRPRGRTPEPLDQAAEATDL
ncbi:MAG TPA: MFS transporter [Caulobacteraceae bacterium]|nr:MFS transporter [Caulobacteraceae bacterium]